jgi:hypothetical protein
MRTRTTLFIPAVIAGALTLTSLAGCSSTTTGGDSTATATASSSSSASPSATSEKLPSDFPKSDVPLVDGIVLVARGDKNDGWSVTVQPKTKTGFADAGAALQKAGFTQQPGATDSKAVYSNGTYTVAISTPGASVTYLVTAN